MPDTTTQGADVMTVTTYDLKATPMRADLLLDADLTTVTGDDHRAHVLGFRWDVLKEQGEASSWWHVACIGEYATGWDDPKGDEYATRGHAFAIAGDPLPLTAYNLPDPVFTGEVGCSWCSHGLLSDMRETVQSDAMDSDRDR